MQVRRSRPVVDRFSYEKQGINTRDPSETTLKTDMVLLSKEIKDAQMLSTVGIQLEFVVVFSRFVINGKINQINYIVGKEIQDETDFSAEELHDLLAPLFDVIHRLTYEVSEIILDEPGVDLDFSPITEVFGKEVKK